MNIERPSISRRTCGVLTSKRGGNKCQVDEDQDQAPGRDRVEEEDDAGTAVAGEEEDVL